MGQTVVEKIAEYNLAEGPADAPIRAGDFVSIWPSHVLTHDNSASVMKKFKSLGVPRLRAPRQPVFALDHDVQNMSEANQEKYKSIEAFAKEHGIDFYPAGTGTFVPTLEGRGLLSVRGLAPEIVAQEKLERGDTDRDDEQEEEGEISLKHSRSSVRRRM